MAQTGALGGATPNHRGLHDCAVSHDGQTAVTAGNRLSPAFWDVQNDRLKIIVVCAGHKAGADTTTFSEDGKFAISHGIDETKVWELPSGKCLTTFNEKRA